MLAPLPGAGFDGSGGGDDGGGHQAIESFFDTLGETTVGMAADVHIGQKTGGVPLHVDREVDGILSLDDLAVDLLLDVTTGVG